MRPGGGNAFLLDHHPVILLSAQRDRFRAEVMAPGESFDQTGCAGPLPPHVAPVDAGQGERFGDDDAPPDSADGEPIFGSASGGQACTTDDGVPSDLSACDAQADAPDGAE